MGVLDGRFSVTEDRFGEHVVVELRQGGATQDVTGANKEEYIELVVSHLIARRIAEQFRPFMEGLEDVLLLDLLWLFDEHELELLIGGMKEIDMDDWTQFTDYRGYEKVDGPGDRVVLGGPPLVACGTQGTPAPIDDGHLARARQRLQGSPRQRRPAPLYDRE